MPEAGKHLFHNRCELSPPSEIEMRSGRRSFAQKNSSIVLDTHTLWEQDHVEVSPFEARLPLPSPNAVSIKATHRIGQ
jgi:hypothetical protein